MTNHINELDDVIVAAYDDATRFHGDLGLSCGSWRAKIRAILERCHKDSDAAAAIVFVQRLHSRDLYLATCCAERLDAGWRRFETLHQKYIQDLVRCLASNALQAFDVGEGLMVDLFLPDRSGHSRISSYDGRSSLATWLHVIVTHRVSNERVRKWNKVERPGDMPDVADQASPAEFEVDWRARRYGPVVDKSLRKACEGLSARDKRMLVWRYQRGLLLEDIARLLSIHPSTVCRQLERLHDRLRRDVITTLTKTYGLPDAVVDECMRDVLESRMVSVSLLRLIGETLPKDDESVAAAQPELRLA
jgi:RNA polymerase sigma-70 factor